MQAGTHVPGQEGLIQSAIRRDKPFSLFARDHLAAGLDAEPYMRNMISDILGDEDYQRVILGDYTADELIRHGVHDISNGDQPSFTHEPLHE